MPNIAHIAADDIRSAFSRAMSDMYRQEVPLYGELLDIVAQTNAVFLRTHPVEAAKFARSGELDRLGIERHGAIRVGTAAELSLLRRAFAVMGMYPVGYYDLAVAGVPVYATAFRPVSAESLQRNPFRIFTSLLRTELIEDEPLRDIANQVLVRRRIVSEVAEQLIDKAERDGGLEASDADIFTAEMLETFRWRSEALVSSETYEALHAAHRLVADVVSFQGPHINHLTPRTLDIDAAQAEMVKRGIETKAVIEGPPARAVPILLRQTSFKALEETIRFSDQTGENLGSHTARFGEIEQRGVALTPQGRFVYDALLDEARGADGSSSENYDARLKAAFDKFPDDEDELRRQGLAYFRFHAVGTSKTASADASVEDLLDSGHLRAEPIIYEDFLPVSAAGIFQSNLGGGEQRSFKARVAQEEFETALGCKVFDPFALYEAIEQESLADARAKLARFALQLPAD